MNPSAALERMMRGFWEVPELCGVISEETQQQLSQRGLVS